MSITTIIVNYNAGETLGDCVAALSASSVPTRISIIDNASTDNSARELIDRVADRKGIEFLFNQSNLGFAPAVNQVAGRVSSDYLLILNPDCIVHPEALGRLKAALESDPRAALAGPAVQDEQGRVQRATVRRFPGPWKSFLTASGLWRLGRWKPFFHGVEVDTTKLGEGAEIMEAVSGACMLIRTEAFRAVGLLDEGYTMHCEDLDLMYRLAEQGWHCLYVPAALAVHRQGLSSRSRPGWVHFQKHRGMTRFFRKFQAGSTPWPLRVLVYIGIWLRFVVLWPLAMIRR